MNLGGFGGGWLEDPRQWQAGRPQWTGLFLGVPSCRAAERPRCWARPDLRRRCPEAPIGCAQEEAQERQPGTGAELGHTAKGAAPRAAELPSGRALT